MKYFTSEKISENIIRIRDICGVYQYLVIGDEKACLLDTGCGFGNLREYVETLTDKDYFVILTHGHIDHASGASLFEDKGIYMNLLDKELLKVHTAFEVRKEHAKVINETAEIPKSEYNPLFNGELLPLTDGQEFDLGNLTIQAIHTPGHTQGMTMILIKEERTILFGDGCGVSVLILDEYASSVSEYLDTLLTLKNYENQYDYIIRNHGTGKSPKDLLDNVIECCKCVINGTDDKYPARNIPIKVENAFFAKALKDNSTDRVDGKEGNIVYTLDKIK